MSSIIWYPFLETGHDGVDHDHRTLLAIINRLADPDARQKEGHVSTTMAELIGYTVEHFAREEDMMRTLGWTEIDRHIRLHRDMVTQAMMWDRRIRERWRPWLGGSLFVFAAEWLVRHIADEDARVGVFARTGRVPPRVVRKAFGDFRPHMACAA